MIDVEIYNRNQEVKHRKNLTWEDAKKWIIYSAGRTKEYDEISIRIYTIEDMPVDSCSVSTVEEAIDFLDAVLDGVKNGLYERINLLI